MKNTKNIKTITKSTKRFFIEITDPETNQTHISEFNQSKIFHSIEACKSFLDDNFIVDNKNNLVVRYWETDQGFNGEGDTNIDKNSYLGTSGRQVIEIQRGIELFLPHENDDQNSVSVSNWIVRIGSGPTVSDKLENRCVILKNNKALVDWTDNMAHDLRPEAILRLYALRGQYPVVENNNNDSNIRNLDNPQSAWESEKEIAEYRFFTEGKKGVEIYETKFMPFSTWMVKPLLVWKKFIKTMIVAIGVLNQNYAKNITIPASINGNYVNAVRESAFENCKNLKTVVISKSVAFIGAASFHGCTALENVVVPNSVKSIGKSAFKGCTSLKKIVLPSSITSIGRSAFCDCTGLEEIILPKSIVSIKSRVFYGCTALKRIVLPKDIVSIKEWAFMGCTALEKIKLPNSVTYIGKGAFKNCIALKSVDIPDSIRSIETEAFCGCTTLEKVVIPDSATFVVGWKVFKDCDSLKSKIKSRYSYT